MAFSEEVKSAARGRWLELLTEIGGIHRDLLDGKHHQCPRCGGKDRFRLIDENDGAVLCNQCFNAKNGDGISAIQWMRGCSFKEALSLLADRLGVKKRRQKKAPDELLRFEEWNSSRAEWCRIKGISEEIAIAEGGQMADWKGWGVIAFPILGTKADSKPRGYVIVNRRGGLLKARSGDAKILVTEGSKTGWIGKASLARLDTARVIWKVEGVTDMLALVGAIPEADRPAHAVLTNPFGSTENPKRDLLEVFRGKLVAVVHDPDDAGEKGAAKWAAAIADVASDTRIVRLPGKLDLRDWIGQGSDFAALRALANATEQVLASPRQGASDGEQDAAPDQADEIEEDEEDNLRIAKLFVRQRGRRFSIHDGAPHWWRENRWLRSNSIEDLRRDVTFFIQQEFERLAQEQVEERKRKGEDPPKRKKINAQLVGSVLSLVRSIASIPSEISYGSMLERDEEGYVIGAAKKNLISFQNGILDLDALLESGRTILIDHSPDWWSLARLPYGFDAAAKIGPQWTAFLGKNLAGDERMIECLQEWLGYCLLPHADHHKFLIMIGEGANGKSVFCAVAEALLGEENVSHVPLELFGQRFALSSTLGKLCNIATETHDIDRIAEGYLKQFVDGSKMIFDRKGLPAIEARPTAKLMIATNQPPRFSDKSLGLWRRMLVAPFQIEIKAEERILGLDKPDWWLRRGELPGLFNWAVEGLQRLATSAQFTIPEISEMAKEDYRETTNPAREFLLSDYMEDPAAEPLRSSRVYMRYRKWCEAEGYKPLGSRMFGKEIKRTFPGSGRRRAASLDRDTGTRGYEYVGIRLIEGETGVYL